MCLPVVRVGFVLAHVTRARAVEELKEGQRRQMEEAAKAHATEAEEMARRFEEKQQTLQEKYKEESIQIHERAERAEQQLLLVRSEAHEEEVPTQIPEDERKEKTNRWPSHSSRRPSKRTSTVWARGSPVFVCSFFLFLSRCTYLRSALATCTEVRLVLPPRTGVCDPRDRSLV